MVCNAKKQLANSVLKNVPVCKLDRYASPYCPPPLIGKYGLLTLARFWNVTRKKCLNKVHCTQNLANAEQLSPNHQLKLVSHLQCHLVPACCW